jgi:hypothetical protein
MAACFPAAVAVLSSAHTNFLLPVACGCMSCCCCHSLLLLLPPTATAAAAAAVIGGRHPFGDAYDRDPNILRGAATLTPLQRWPEAVNLVAAMLQKSPGARPTMSAVLSHPFWWSDEQKLQFLVDVSDRSDHQPMTHLTPSLISHLFFPRLSCVG